MTTPLEDLENELATRPQQVLVVAGAGVSIATDPTNRCASWPGLLRHGLQWCLDRDPRLKPDSVQAYETLLERGDMLAVAGFVARQLRAMHAGEYGHWLEESVGKLAVRDETVIRALLGWDAQIATTNYDTLIEECAGQGSVTWREPNLVMQFVRAGLRHILHIHGHYRFPGTVVLDARAYEDICRDPEMQAVLQSILVMRTVVFVGCGAGLSDPNFASLLAWARATLAHSPYSHFRLVRQSELEAVARECDGLPIRPVVYGSNYANLGPFLSQLGDRARVRRARTPELELLTRGQADYMSRCQALEAERAALDEADFIRRRLQLARELWNIGGRRTAALDMDGVFFHDANSLSPADRVVVGLEVADMLLDDELPRYAAAVLQRLLPDLDGPGISPEALVRFRRQQVRSTNDLCAYGEALAAIGRALGSATSDERVRLEAQRAEMQLLQGELFEAARGCDGGDLS